MGLELVADEKHLGRGDLVVSVSPGRKKLTLYKAAREMMTEHYGQEFEQVLLFRDEEAPDKFWIRPCGPKDSGARKLDSPSPATRTLSISLLLKKLKWMPKKTIRLPISWDAENKAAVVTIDRSK